MNKQCKDEFIISTELNIRYKCIKKEKHKGKHTFVWIKYSKQGKKLNFRKFFSY